jgi:pSer/pThr/pTyr-binding forkhead associated (FHA) protein
MIRGDQNMPAFVGTNAFLVLQRPGATLLPRNKVYEIYDNTVLGRKSDCAIILNDPLISDHHAIIIKKQTKWYLRDLGSTNKTLVNGLQVNSDAELVNGDIIGIGGRVELRMHLVERTK